MQSHRVDGRKHLPNSNPLLNSYSFIMGFGFLVTGSFYYL
jgi:hypothetical protein